MSQNKRKSQDNLDFLFWLDRYTKKHPSKLSLAKQSFSGASERNTASCSNAGNCENPMPGCSQSHQLENPTMEPDTSRSLSAIVEGDEHETDTTSATEIEPNLFDEVTVKVEPLDDDVRDIEDREKTRVSDAEEWNMNITPRQALDNHENRFDDKKELRRDELMQYKEEFMMDPNHQPVSPINSLNEDSGLSDADQMGREQQNLLQNRCEVHRNEGAAPNLPEYRRLIELHLASMEELMAQVRMHAAAVHAFNSELNLSYDELQYHYHNGAHNEPAAMRVINANPANPNDAQYYDMDWNYVLSVLISYLPN